MNQDFVVNRESQDDDETIKVLQNVDDWIASGTASPGFIQEVRTKTNNRTVTLKKENDTVVATFKQPEQLTTTYQVQVDGRLGKLFHITNLQHNLTTNTARGRNVIEGKEYTFVDGFDSTNKHYFSAMESLCDWTKRFRQKS